MFKRRKPLTPLQNVKQFFWPKMGWVRMGKYIKLRVIRLADSTPKIALGLAIGVGVSFSPFIGTHLIQAAILAFILRANIVASLIGTIIGNPWTFPFMWWAATELGSVLFEIFGFPASVTLPHDMGFSDIITVIKTEPSRIFTPWLLGGYILAVFFIVATYPIFYKVVDSAKQARKRARERKLHAIAKQVTGQKQ